MWNWGDSVAPEWQADQGHLPNPAVQGKQPWLILILSLLKVVSTTYTKAGASSVPHAAGSPELPFINALLMEKAML